MPEIESPKIIQEEIKALEQKLAQKQMELAESAVEVRKEDTAKEVIKEYTGQAAQPAAQTSDDDAKKAADKLASEPHSRQVAELLNIAQDKGILGAVRVAKHLKNPHLLDDFHDLLVLELLKNKK